MFLLRHLNTVSQSTFAFHVATSLSISVFNPLESGCRFKTQQKQLDTGKNNYCSFTRLCYMFPDQLFYLSVNGSVLSGEGCSVVPFPGHGRRDQEPPPEVFSGPRVLLLPGQRGGREPCGRYESASSSGHHQVPRSAGDQGRCLDAKAATSHPAMSSS